MTTTLYIITMSAWHVFLTFREEDQIVRCAEMRDHVEFVFDVEAKCLSLSEDVMLLDDQIYQRKNT